MQHNTNLAEFLNQTYTVKERKRLLTRHRSKLVVRIFPRMIASVRNAKKLWLYVRIRVNGIGVKTDIATFISIEPGTWDIDAKRIRGHSAKIDEKNRALAQIENDFMVLYNDLRQQGVVPTAEMLKDIYMKSRSQSLENLGFLAYCKSYLEYHSSAVSAATVKGNNSKLTGIIRYLKATKQRDVTLNQIDPRWAMAFHRFMLQNECGLDHARRVIGLISRVLDFAVMQSDLENNPLKSLTLPRSRQKPIKYLAFKEIEQLQTCPYFDRRLQKVVDCFLVQCYTGLAYHDLKMFDPQKHLKVEQDGQEWIMIRRGKTGILSTIPVIAQTKQLLEKYNYRLPIISNQKLNEFIKEAAQIAGLSNPNEITTHVGRKTAGTFFLNHGLPLETVSKVLGHQSVKITQSYYAELLTETVKNNFKMSGLL